MELLAPPPASAPRIAASEELGALPLFQLYAQHVAMPDQALADGTAILQAPHSLTPTTHCALGVLLQGSVCSMCPLLHVCGFMGTLKFDVFFALRQDLAGQGAALHREEAAIELRSLELEGFGPYRCCPAPLDTLVSQDMTPLQAPITRASVHRHESRLTCGVSRVLCGAAGSARGTSWARAACG